MADDKQSLLLPAGVNPNALFMLWQHLGGDDRRASEASGVDVRIITALAHDFRWKDLAGGRLGLKDEKLEKEINRAQSYVQAQRIRGVIDRVVSELEQDQTLQIAMRSVDDEGNIKISIKPFVELAKAAEAAHNMAYRALGDKVATEADVAGVPDAERIKNLSLTINTLVTNAAEKLTTPVKIVTDVKETIGV